MGVPNFFLTNPVRACVLTDYSESILGIRTVLTPLLYFLKDTGTKLA